MRTIGATAVLAFILMAHGPAGAADDSTARGKALVEQNCAGCHALTEAQVSAHADAPAFSTLSQRYPLDALEEAFVEGISTGHPDMPEFVATPDQIQAIIGYLDTLQPD